MTKDQGRRRFPKSASVLFFCAALIGLLLFLGIGGIGGEPFLPVVAFAIYGLLYLVAERTGQPAPERLEKLTLAATALGLMLGDSPFYAVRLRWLPMSYIYNPQAFQFWNAIRVSGKTFEFVGLLAFFWSVGASAWAKQPEREA